MPSISANERYVSTSAGELYVKSWTPSEVSNTETTAPIVLFHDSLGSVELWRGFPEQLARTLGRQVIAYDRPGFGHSYPRTDILEADFIINEATGPFTAIRDELGIEDFIAFGHSVGGAITEAAQAFVEDLTVQGIRNAKQDFAQDGQIDRLKKYHGEKADWVLRAWTGTWLSDNFQHWTLNETLSRVSCPVLAIHGEDDEFGSTAHPELYTSLPAGPCVLEMLKECGHVPHREKPDVVVRLVNDFIEKHLVPC